MMYKSFQQHNTSNLQSATDIKLLDIEQIWVNCSGKYVQGKEDAEKFTITEINYDKVRSEISEIKDVRAARPVRIMDIIQNMNFNSRRFYPNGKK